MSAKPLSRQRNASADAVGAHLRGYYVWRHLHGVLCFRVRPRGRRAAGLALRAGQCHVAADPSGDSTTVRAVAMRVRLATEQFSSGQQLRWSSNR